MKDILSLYTTIIGNFVFSIENDKKYDEKFWKSLDIWILKPHVLDRRILSSIVIEKRTFNHNHVGLEENLLGRSGFIHEYVMATETENLHGDTIEESQGNVTVITRKILPRQSDRMQPYHEIVVKDFSRLEIFFIRLSSVSGHTHLPDDVNQLWAYKVSCNVEKQALTVSVSKLYSEEHPVSCLPELTPPTKEWLSGTLLPKLVKWMGEVDPTMPIVVKDSLISMERYSIIHGSLKARYAEKIIGMWTETTDPQKFVYEDISIAAYLIVLWEEERERLGLKTKQSFVDLGCGNGLLVHILNSEGHPGKGVDLRKRKIWDFYENTNLEEQTITPGSGESFKDYDWLIGNHSDELTPWIPVMAFRSSENTRYFVLPCCFHDFDKKFVKREAKETQYRSYLNFIREVGEKCGFKVGEDHLRIPSTKRICQVGFTRTDCSHLRASIDNELQRYINERCLLSHLNLCDDESRTILRSLSSDGGESSEHDPVGWVRSFEPRPREETMRNCSTVSKDLKEEIVGIIFRYILSEDKKNAISLDECDGHERKKQRTWEKGGKLSITEAAGLVDSKTLKELKSEYGGLKTLLKNYHQIFELSGDSIKIRDWSDPSSRESKSGSSKNRKRDSSKKGEKLKTKPCWFFSNHPDGCPLTKDECTYAHGVDDLRTLRSQVESITLGKSPIRGRQLSSVIVAQTSISIITQL